MSEAPAILVDGEAGRLTIGDWSCACVIGKGGLIAAADKREGDGASPIGDWPVRAALLRPGRIDATQAPAIPWRWLRPNDGWSDDPADPAYNRPVHLPRHTSHERLAREDQAYDVIIVLGHNDAPPAPGMGSAIFFHQWVIGENGQPKATEGCVAIAPEDMRTVLGLLRPGMMLRLR
ncbi:MULTISPECIES: L,D-transpeptidase family protein [Sphingobium]|uniref:L,D-transpeptidase family protein n=1 Tax=Sphingobium TaxID=165695 RepID=UPI00182A9177|nr:MULTISPECIES: L,D-transpeptidase family protein [Sphingobium]MCW2363713.1 L,D-peptidoglycan transpeptidase YkuD (ErfK/YbiS/YcfS/YnhG family) [Sphingobium sp. B10D3B]MCW2402889.1 L,D-peptidoglycan transpeptidase YkuD (ErfK/YbiS/YcfS/YnhG family) [Sphingobium sp. B10D7B]MCW2409867.1 L,D-peptidoglycan transpeptidase YkuD (ErfK/YbiS/YcfS/YnhG family) [Sphingobium xanthum]